jgi:hypothetical protein
METMEEKTDLVIWTAPANSSSHQPKKKRSLPPSSPETMQPPEQTTQIQFLQRQILDLKNLVLQLNQELQLLKTQVYSTHPTSSPFHSASPNATQPLTARVPEVLDPVPMVPSAPVVQPVGAPIQATSQPGKTAPTYKLNSAPKYPPNSSSMPPRSGRPPSTSVKKSLAEILKASLKDQEPPAIIQFLSKKAPVSPIETVDRITLQFSFASVALRSPFAAWKQLFQACTGEVPLSVSILSKTQAEFYVDAFKLAAIHIKLASCPTVKVIQNVVPTDKDTGRLAHCYLRGFFKTLRESVLFSIPYANRIRVLNDASTLLGKVFTDKVTRDRWKSTIAYDLKQLV